MAGGGGYLQSRVLHVRAHYSWMINSLDGGGDGGVGWLAGSLLHGVDGRKKICFLLFHYRKLQMSGVRMYALTYNHAKEYPILSSWPRAILASQVLAFVRWNLFDWCRNEAAGPSLLIK